MLSHREMPRQDELGTGTRRAVTRSSLELLPDRCNEERQFRVYHRLTGQNSLSDDGIVAWKPPAMKQKTRSRANHKKAKTVLRLSQGFPSYSHSFTLPGFSLRWRKTGSWVRDCARTIRTLSSVCTLSSSISRSGNFRFI